MADAIVLGVLAVLTFVGLRRGFFREVLGAGALVGATWAAARYAPELGSEVATRIGTSAEIGYVVAGAGLWALCYIGIQIVGRAVISRLKRAPDDEDEAYVRGAISSFFRSVDTILGAALGLAKGALVCALVLYVAQDLQVEPVHGFFGDTVAAQVYDGFVAPAASLVPEVRVARSVGSVKQIAAVLKQHPDRLERLTGHPDLRALRSYRPLQEVLEDPELRRVIREKQIDAILRHEKVQGLLRDRQLMRHLADVRFKAVLADVRGEAPPDWLFPVPPAPGEPPSSQGQSAHPRYPLGEVVIAAVTHVTAAGVYLRLDEQTYGLIRTEDLSWTRFASEQATVYSVGDRARARVLAADGARGYVSLGRKQLLRDPFEDADLAARFQTGSEHRGSVIRISSTGVVVRFRDEVEAFLPAATLPPDRFNALRRGGRIDVRVTLVDPARRLLQIGPPGS